MRVGRPPLSHALVSLPSIEPLTAWPSATPSSSHERPGGAAPAPEDHARLQGPRTPPPTSQPPQAPALTWSGLRACRVSSLQQLRLARRRSGQLPSCCHRVLPRLPPSPMSPGTPPVGPEGYAKFAQGAGDVATGLDVGSKVGRGGRRSDLHACFGIVGSPRSLNKRTSPTSNLRYRSACPTSRTPAWRPPARVPRLAWPPAPRPPEETSMAPCVLLHFPSASVLPRAFDACARPQIALLSPPSSSPHPQAAREAGRPDAMRRGAPEQPIEQEREAGAGAKGSA